MLIWSSSDSLDRLFILAWSVWWVTWMLASVWRSRAVKRPSLGAQIPYRVLTIIGAVLLFDVYPRRISPLWKPAPAVPAVLFALTIIGLLFTWWARLHLGRLWSGTVTRKADHRVVDSGPYRIVRHPIYTGLILAAISTALFRATATAIAGALVLAFSFYVKARLEERFLRSELGPAYDQYAARVRMLIPYVFISALMLGSGL